MTTDAAATVGPPVGMKIRLSSNESPYGPSPAAVAAAREAAAEVHRYPDDQSVALRDALADHEGCTPEEVSVGVGSAAVLLDVVADACRDGGTVLAYERSFVVYRLAAANAGVAYVEVPTGGPATTARGGYARDPQDLLDHVDRDTACVLVDNPGNPTGVHLDGDALRRLVAGIPEHVTVVVDEAYHPFAVGHGGYGTVAELGLEHPRLLVMRTFSKAHALAGMRVGYVRGPAAVVAAIDGRRSRFNLTTPAQVAAVAALAGRDHLARTVAGTLAGRRRLQDWLTGAGVAHTPSLGNFVTLDLGRPAGPVVDAFARHEIGVRGLAPYGMHDQVRVTIGTPEEMDAFLAAASEVLAPAAS